MLAVSATSQRCSQCGLAGEMTNGAAARIAHQLGFIAPQACQRC